MTEDTTLRAQWTSDVRASLRKAFIDERDSAKPYVDVAMEAIGPHARVLLEAEAALRKENDDLRERLEVVAQIAALGMPHLLAARRGE